MAIQPYPYPDLIYDKGNVHSHLRHAKRPMAVKGGGGGGGGFEQWSFSMDEVGFLF